MKKNILRAIALVLLSFQVNAKVTISESSLPLGSDEKSMLQILAQKITSTCEGQNKTPDLEHILCGTIGDSIYSCSVPCFDSAKEIQDGAQTLTPVNSFDTYNCNNDNCKDEAKFKNAKLALYYKNKAMCDLQPSGRFELPPGHLVETFRNSQCQVHRMNQDAIVVCHNLCARPTKQK